MSIDENIYPYISGEKFSSGILLKLFDDKDKSIYRIELLEALVSGKKIIHLGCLNHVPLIMQKIKKNVWLHKRLTDASDICLGIDIDRDGVEYVRNQVGFENVIYGNMVNDSIVEIEETHWDLIIIGEVLEHVDNPVEFLETIRLKYRDLIDNAIITVPNAFRMTNFENAYMDVEFVNSDHRYWFTPYTLWKVIDRAGLKLIDVKLCQSVRPEKWSYWRNFWRNRKITHFPLFREAIVAICSFNR